MTYRTRDGNGNRVIVRGRSYITPFGRIPDWPQRQEGLDAMQAAESAENEQRAAYRQRERQQPCGACGALTGSPHNAGCAPPWG